MRITGGTAKGQRLKLPKNYLIRPTTDRTREAVFSILASLGNDLTRVLDLYAGSGALGIEALSRGVEMVDFVDQEPRCCAIIKQNLEKVGFARRARVYCCTVTKALAFLDSKYDIIFMDAPYSDTAIEGVVMQLADSDNVTDKSLVVISHASRFSLAGNYGGLHLAKEKRYGDTSISIYCREGYN